MSSASVATWPQTQAGLRGGAEAARRLAAEEALHGAVLQRMEREDDEAATVSEQAVGTRERRVQERKLLIDGNPESLKRPGGGVDIT